MEEKIYVSELAGHCNEMMAWQILKEVSETLIQKGLRSIDPYCIEIDDNGHFSLATTTANHDDFNAPETIENQLNEAGTTWSLCATVFFVIMGCQVMNGKGGKGQKASSKLPYMRSEWPELSELVQQCLQFHPTRRPTLQQVHDKALQQYQRCMDEIRKGPKFKTMGKVSQTETDLARQDLAFWPEIMQKPMSNPYKDKSL